MSLQYKIDVLAALKAKGWTSYRLRKEKILGERVIQQLRDGVPVSWEVLSRLCDLLSCNIGDLLTFTPDAAGAGTRGGYDQGIPPFPDSLSNSEQENGL